MTRHPLRRGTNKPVLLEYVDSSGDRSMRGVMPLALLATDARRQPESTYLHARCSIAKSVRSFRFDRIQAITDPATGEVLPAEVWVSGLQLSDGRPFTWADDEHQAEHETTAEAVAAPKRRRPAWQIAGYAGVGGYAIGRLRLAHLALHALGIHSALWL